MEESHPPPAPSKEKEPPTEIIDKLVSILPLNDKQQAEYKEALASIYNDNNNTYQEKDAPYFVVIHRVISEIDNYKLLSELTNIIYAFNTMVAISSDNDWLKSVIHDLLTELYTKLESIKFTDTQIELLYHTKEQFSSAKTHLLSEIKKLFDKTVDVINTKVRVEALPKLPLHSAGSRRTKSKRKQSKSKRKRKKSKRKRTKSKRKRTKSKRKRKKSKRKRH